MPKPWGDNGFHQSQVPTSAVGVSVTRNLRARQTIRCGSPIALVQTLTGSSTLGTGHHLIVIPNRTYVR